jgi:hypothetical protein
MIVLLALAAAAPSAPPPPADRAPSSAVASARASVRILHSGSASQKDWSDSPPSRKREILIREADGRTVRLRLVEYQ